MLEVKVKEVLESRVLSKQGEIKGERERESLRLRPSSSSSTSKMQID